MKIKFKYHWYVKLICFGIPIFIFLLNERTPHPQFYDALVPISLIGAIMTLFIYYTVNDKGLSFYSITKKITIDWDEIESIVLLPALKGIGISVRVAIFSKGKRIVIISWINNYKEILRRVIAEAEKREIEKIDREVVALLK